MGFVVILALTFAVASHVNAWNALNDAREGRGMETMEMAMMGARARARAPTECRARAFRAFSEYFPLATSNARDFMSTNEACEAIAKSPSKACVVAASGTGCRVEGAGARTRAGACARSEKEGECERCVLRALGAERGQNVDDDIRDDGDVEGDGEDGERAMTLERGVEFALYMEEIAAVDRECKHHMAIWRAESAAYAIDELAIRMERARRDARAHAEAISGTLSTLDAAVAAQSVAVRALDVDVRSIERSAKEAQNVTLAFKRDFESFSSAVFDALTRLEHATANALAAARFAADVAKKCLSAVNDAYVVFTTIESAMARFILVAFAIVRRRGRPFVASALAVDWAVGRLASWMSPAARLRCGVIVAAVALPVARVARKFGSTRKSKSIARSALPKIGRRTKIVAPAEAPRRSARMKQPTA